MNILDSFSLEKVTGLSLLQWRSVVQACSRTWTYSGRGFWLLPASMNVIGLSLLPTEVTVQGLVPQRLLTQAFSYGRCCLGHAPTYVLVLSLFPQRSLPWSWSCGGCCLGHAPVNVTKAMIELIYQRIAMNRKSNNSEITKSTRLDTSPGLQ